MNEIEKKLFCNINLLFENISLKNLKSASKKLSEKYQRQQHKYFSSEDQRYAYIACRMPATFKAIEYVLNEIKTLAPSIKINSALDLGSGPLTSLWALFSTFKSLNKVHLVERDEKLLSLGKKLSSQESFFKKAEIERNNILKIKNYDFDIVILSYVANELKNPIIEKIINRWAFSKSKVIVFVEPGTMYGFKKIKFIRQKLIDAGFNIIAPCPNALKCPMPKNDWCHFYVRVKRSKKHKYLKGGTLGYEDEKFSYVIATKEKVSYPKARILRFVKKSNQELIFTLCQDGKMIKEKVLRKDKTKYKKAQKINWGDVFDV